LFLLKWRISALRASFREQFLKLNAELSKGWPVITKAKAAPADADEWKDVKEKLEHLER
jgi:ferredoxin